MLFLRRYLTMDFRNIVNAKSYPVTKAPTVLQKVFNYFTPREQFWIKPGNDLKAAIRTIAIHTKQSEQQVLRNAINIGVSAMEEIVTQQASYYRKEDGSYELIELVLTNGK